LTESYLQKSLLLQRKAIFEENEMFFQKRNSALGKHQPNFNESNAANRHETLARS